MKKHTWVDTLKELLKELSVIPLFALFLSVAILVGLLLPDGFLKNLPIEVLFVLAVIVILAVLYAISGIVMVIQKIKAKRGQDVKDADGA